MTSANDKKPESALSTWGEPLETPTLSSLDEEPARVWYERINAEIRFDSKFLTGAMAAQLVDLATHGAAIPSRFCDLFAQANPPIEMLEYTKRLAKGVRHRADSPAEKVATALYYSAIVAALVRCGRRITELDDAALSFGIGWVLDQHWIDAATRRLFVDASAYLKSHPSESVS
jgi:hypothetical protein